MPGEQHRNAARADHVDDRRQVLARHRRRQPPQRVVAAEGDDEDAHVWREQLLDALPPAGGRVAAHAAVEDLNVAVALGVEQLFDLARGTPAGTSAPGRR